MEWEDCQGGGGRVGGGKIKGQLSLRHVGTMVVSQRMWTAPVVQSGRALPMGRCASPPGASHTYREGYFQIRKSKFCGLNINLWSEVCSFIVCTFISRNGHVACPCRMPLSLIVSPMGPDCTH